MGVLSGLVTVIILPVICGVAVTCVDMAALSSSLYPPVMAVTLTHSLIMIFICILSTTRYRKMISKWPEMCYFCSFLC